MTVRLVTPKQLAQGYRVLNGMLVTHHDFHIVRKEGNNYIVRDTVKAS